MLSPLVRLRDLLTSMALRHDASNPLTPYRIPALWCAPYSTNGIISIDNPARYLADVIDGIMIHSGSHPSTPAESQDLTRNSVVYSMLIRHATAFPHHEARGEVHGENNDEVHGETSDEAPGETSDEAPGDTGDDAVLSSLFTMDGWRTTGTFIKSIALLPYIASLGVDTLYLLPVQQPSMVHRKGSSGSVFALRDVEELDASLAETVIDMSVDDQFRAFVEAAHLLGLRVLCEFALRTVGRDCAWIEEHPEWFYWVRRSTHMRPEQPREHDVHDLRPPSFTPEELERIAHHVEAKDWHDLPEPSPEYRAMFCEPPESVERLHDGSYAGSCGDGHCLVPGAFADYPPDDTQPLWDDVTYLKLHTHPQFNYVAYNTVRIYDERLRDPRCINKTLWFKLHDVIPSFVRRFAIDGAILDMSHALPDELRAGIVSNARALRPGFMMIEENFERDNRSAELGFDAVLGNVWWHAQSMSTLRSFVVHHGNDVSSMPFFATPDTHNTPRCAARLTSEEVREAYRLVMSLPHGIPMILAGSEFGEQTPMNTGLSFSTEELHRFPASRLALFSAVRMKWENADIALIDHLRTLIAAWRDAGKVSE